MMMATTSLTKLELRKKQLALKKEQDRLKRALPHIYGMKFYKWAREFYESTNKVNLVCAANQISKSSTLIRRCIANATEPSRWPLMFGPNNKPKMFWYFYPDKGTLQKEWHTKWVEDWLPKLELEKHPQYGWKISMKDGVPYQLTFNTGVHVFFQTYTQKVTNVQAGTVHEIYVDEELPLEFYDELMFRLTQTKGIFNAGFTPTKNQLFWKQAIETDKVLSTALKLQVSMYDCLTYEDGSPSTAFTKESIEEIKSKCQSETEIQRRVYGRFVSEQGRTYYGFEFERNMKPRHDVSGWNIYCGCDYGSGGKGGHPAAITFVAVNPTYTEGRVIRSWRGDDIDTTAGDVFNKYNELKADLPQLTMSIYDPSSKDFGVIAERNGVSFVKADKTRDTGEETLNTLFKNDMLGIFEDDDGNLKLAGELAHIMRENQSSRWKNGDDLADALRYTCMMIPWDFSVINERAQAKIKEDKLPPRPLTEAELMARQIEERRGVYGKSGANEDSWDQDVADEVDYWNEQYG